MLAASRMRLLLRGRRLAAPACATRNFSSGSGLGLESLEWAQTATSTPLVPGAAEPALSALGLAGWSPPGLIQSCLEHLHVTHQLPWWGTIVICTVCVRTLIFPIVVYTQRHAAEFNNVMPQMMHLQQKFHVARKSGDVLESRRAAEELAQFMREKNVNPFKNLLGPLAQAPFFVSIFFGLREMAALPVESMRTGGLMWFPDLTLADPLYGLPAVTCLTMWLTIELGVETGKSNAQNAKMIKYAFRVLPFVMLPFISQFPAAILCYWASTNAFSLLQVGFLKVPAVREYFGIPKVAPAPKLQAQVDDKPKDFMEEIRRSWDDMKKTREFEDRKRIGELISKMKPESDPANSIKAKKSE